jgi:hypothetical protein
MDSLQIILARASAEFTPGNDLIGQLTWNLSKVPDRVELRLFWTTFGVGIPESKVVQAVTFDRLLTFDSRAFRFKLPPFPYSYRGKLMSLSWVLEATAFPSRRNIRTHFIMGPGGREVLLPSADGEVFNATRKAA